MGVTARVGRLANIVMHLHSLLAPSLRDCLSALVLMAAVILVVGCAPNKPTAPRAAVAPVLSVPLWSSSGQQLLVQQGLGSPAILLSVDRVAGQATTVADSDERSVIDSWAWASQGTELCCVLTNGNRRVLRVSDTGGRTLREAELPPEFSSTGLEWTRDGRIVLVDAEDAPGDVTGKQRSSGMTSSVLRVYRADLTKEREFSLPFMLYDIQPHPRSAGSIVAVAGGEYRRNVVIVDLATEQVEQITHFGNVPYGPGRWKYVLPGMVYFIQRDAGDYSSNGVYMYDTKTSTVKLAVQGVQAYGEVARFDVCGDRGAIDASRGLYLVDLATGRASALSSRKDVHCPVFSPNGRSLAMLRDLRALVVMDLSSGKDTLLYTAK